MSVYIYPKNFSRHELLASETAERLGIENTPDNAQVEKNLVNLAYTLQEIKDRMQKHFKRNVYLVISSGYRSPNLNKAIGSTSKRSAHLYGLAADFKATTLTPKQVLEFIDTHCKDLVFDQLIEEFGRWVHIGIIKPNTNETRRMFLMARRNSVNKVYYSFPDYLVAE